MERGRGQTILFSIKKNYLLKKALKMFGTDFSMIAMFFKTRSRQQIKNKFNKEEKTNKKKIDHCLNTHSKTFYQNSQ